MALELHVYGVPVHDLGDSANGLVRRCNCQGGQEQQRQEQEMEQFHKWGALIINC